MRNWQHAILVDILITIRPQSTVRVREPRAALHPVAVTRLVASGAGVGVRGVAVFADEAGAVVEEELAEDREGAADND